MKTFSDLGISPKLVKGLTELGIINPTEIQEQAIPVLLEKPTDFVGQAQTGTGKTAAYGLPMLELINASKNHVQALVLCPTRELAMQVSKQLFKFTKYSDKIFSETVYGGAQIDKQIKENTEIINLNNNTIIIKTTTPTWKTELSFQKTELLKIINNKLKPIKPIKDIRFI